MSGDEERWREDTERRHGKKKKRYGRRQETAQRGCVAEAAAAMATIQVLKRVS